MKVRFRSTLAACLALAGLTLGSAGCGGNSLEQRDLGDTATPINPTPVIENGYIDPFVPGRWRGQAQDLFAASGSDGVHLSYAFPSGSTDITLELREDGGTGVLVFGAGLVPEPQPQVAYPPSFDAYAGYVTTLQGGKMPLPPVEGFGYSLYRVAPGDDPTGVAAGALGLVYAANEAYAAWCLLQTPRQNVAGGFDCMTSVATVDPVECGIYQAYDCNLGALCQPDSVCHCYSRGCSLQPDQLNQLWLIRDGDDLLGNFVGAAFDYGNVYLFLPPGPVRFRREGDLE